MRNGGENEVRRTTTVHQFAQREIDDSNEIINHKGRETEEKKQANETRRNKKVARRENFVEKIAREFFPEEHISTFDLNLLDRCKRLIIFLLNFRRKFGC